MKHVSNRLSVIIAVMAAAMSAFGAGVNGDDAKGAVAGWVRLREALGDEIDAEPESVATYQGLDGVGEFHVVSLVGGGYVITSGDTEITPILGYSKTGTFDADENSPQWALLTVDVAARAAALEGASSSATTTAGRGRPALPLLAAHSSNASEDGEEHSPAYEWSRLMAAGQSGGKRLQAKMSSAPTDLRVASFVQSKWSQTSATSGNGYSHYYYSNYTPNKYPCGCVATAQSQTMRYFECPKKSVSAKTFKCTVSGVETNITMQGGTYDWAHMPYAPYAVPYDWNNVIGIAKLTSDVGISLCMKYKSSGSGTSSLYVGDSLVSTFGYSNAIADYEGGGVKGNTFKKNVIPSLDAKLPVILGIQGKPKGSATSDAGHSILTDGYGYYNNQLYIHLNFGWSGSDDAWYTPADSDTGAVINASDYNFTNITCTVFNIFTNATQYSVIASGRVLDQSGNAISGATVTAKYNNSTYATATSDARGVYALILPPTSSTRTYTVNATHSAYTSAGALSVRASQTKGDTPVKSGNNYSGGYYIAASNSNSYDNDITMDAKEPEPEPEPTPSLASAYAQSGTENLLLHLDAVENAGVGLHLASPATWADLSGNMTVTGVNSPSFSGDAFVANKSSYFTTASDAVTNALTGTGARFTLELVISHSNQVKQVGSTWQYEYYVYVGSGSVRTLIVDLRGKNSSYPLVQGVQYHATGWVDDAAIKTTPARTAWNERSYIAVVCDGNTATTYCDGSKEIHSITCSTGPTPSGNAISIGANTSGGWPLYADSEICAVRMTSRILSEDERMRNFFVDSQRFGLEGAPDGYRLTNGVVQVRLTEGVEGFEFSTNGTAWAAGEVWADIDQPVTLSARLAARPSMAVVFSNLPAGATVSGGSAAFTPTKPCAVTVSAVQWTNNDGTGSFDSAANWTGGIPQSGEFIVSVSGDTTVIVTNAYHLGDMIVDGTGRVTFTGDGSVGAATLEVGSGLTVDAGGVLSVAGFTGAGNVVLRPVAGTLAISSASTLTGDLTVKTDTNTAFNVTAATSVRKFYVDAATNAVVTLTVGSGGSFKATSEAIVQHGVLKQGSATALGTTPKITVQDGGTFDINGKTIRQETPIYIAGAGAGDWPWALATSSAMASGNYLYDLYLNADATIGKGQFKLGRSNQNSFIYLNGHTLTAKSWLTLRCINTMAGTIDLQNGATINAYNNLNRQTAYRGTTLIVHEGYTISNKTDREVDISYLRMYGGTIGYDSTARDFGVWNELHGYGTIKRLVMGAGAKYYPDGAHYLEVPEKLSGTMKIDLRDIDMTMVKGRIPLFKVGSSEMLPATDVVQFVGGIPGGWHLVPSRNGHGYDLTKSILVIIR